MKISKKTGSIIINILWAILAVCYALDLTAIQIKLHDIMKNE